MSMDSTGVVEAAPRVQRPVAGAPASLGIYERQSSASAVRVGVIGYGYWGPNIVRNLHGLDNCELVAVCDKSQAALRRAHRMYPNVHLTTDFHEILNSPQIDAVAVIT